VGQDRRYPLKNCRQRMCGLIAGCAEQQRVFKVTLQVSVSCSL